MSFLIILVSSDGVEGTAWHEHHGGPIKNGQCISNSRLYVVGPKGVESLLVLEAIGPA